LCADDLGQKGLGLGIVVQGAVFATFFIVHNELHRDLGVVWPIRMGRVWAIALHVSWVTGHLGASRVLFTRYTIVSRDIIKKSLKVLIEVPVLIEDHLR
jgi:hypothetical protein